MNRIRDDSPEAAPILAEMNAILAEGRRRRDAMDEGQTKYITRAYDMLESGEKERYHTLLSSLRPKTKAEARADVAKRRAERLRIARKTD